MCELCEHHVEVHVFVCQSMFFIACMTMIQLHFVGTVSPARHSSLFILAVNVCMWLENKK